ncbi:XRE family transcriptional regulator [Xanthobacter sp. 91]|uniref:helix-turn-helix domain-containing protein n=1 Tax=Xanthobacter sp. 91 TaxID=1117244 RepID=UPI000494FAAB|nr:XRE family transcriptional regulator [Xanthobacter sp. 91]
MTSVFNSDMLLLARQYRGKSQAEVAQDAGLDQGHYSRIERGLLNSLPSTATIEAVATALRFPVSFFTQNDELSGLPLSVHDVAWRKKASVNATDLKRLHAELNLRVMNLRRLLSAIDLAPELPLPRLDADEMGGADKVALFIRKAWMVQDGPIKNLTALCERAGILVILADFAEHVDGVTMRLRDVPPVIFLNKNAPADRMRHSLAHELGHLIMHSIPSDEMEDEADSFAGELLAPSAQLRGDFIGGRVTLERLVQLKRYWRVSVASLLYRGGRAGFLSKNQTDYLWRQLSARGWRKREPEETQFPAETTRLFDHIVTLHQDQFGYTSSDFGALLHLDERDVQLLYGIEPSSRPPRQLRVVK